MLRSSCVIKSAIVFLMFVCLSFTFYTQTQAGQQSDNPNDKRESLIYLPVISLPYPSHLNTLAQDTYRSIDAMVESLTGLPHDTFNAQLFDYIPQFAVAHRIPYSSMDADNNAQFNSRVCSTECAHTGQYGLKLTYQIPENAWGASFNIESVGYEEPNWTPESGLDPDFGFDVTQASHLEAWVKGAQGGEVFEFALWSNCKGNFPGSVNVNTITTVTQRWQQIRIPLEMFPEAVNLKSLCRLSIGFNHNMDPEGTVYLDDIAFVTSSGDRIDIALDESTNVTNIGLYIATLLGAVKTGIEDREAAIAMLNRTLTSLESLPKSEYGFPHTHNHVVSLKPSTVMTYSDLCIKNDSGIIPEPAPNLFSTVDLGNLAAGLTVLKQSEITEDNLSTRAANLLNAMDWSWLYDASVGLPYGCRSADGAPSDWWHYDFLAADSRLAHFIGIGTNKMPAESWNHLKRDRESNRCQSLGNDYWHFEPGWDGGGLFMVLLSAIFLDEAQNELGISTEGFVRDQICYAKEIGASAWGWSATALPPDGSEYCGYGCQRDEILVPHASILAAELVTPTALIENLTALEALGARAPATDGVQTFDFGFRSSVNITTAEVSPVYLVLDQSMVFLSLVNHKAHGYIRELFCQDNIATTNRNLLPDYINSCQN